MFAVLLNYTTENLYVFLVVNPFQRRHILEQELTIPFQVVAVVLQV